MFPNKFENDCDTYMTYIDYLLSKDISCLLLWIHSMHCGQNCFDRKKRRMSRKKLSGEKNKFHASTSQK